jgi:hypothetical protein
MRRTGVDEYIQGRFDAFPERITAERQNDPARAWVHNSPNALAFAMGTLVHDEHRPHIGNKNIYPSQIVIWVSRKVSFHKTALSDSISLFIMATDPRRPPYMTLHQLARDPNPQGGNTSNNWGNNQ